MILLLGISTYSLAIARLSLIAVGLLPKGEQQFNTFNTQLTTQSNKQLNQINAKLNELIKLYSQKLQGLLPPALKPSAPPIPKQTPTYPPTPSVEALEEVEHIQVYKPIQNIKKQPIRQKHRAAKAIPKTPYNAKVFEVFRNIIAWPPKFDGTNMRLSRDQYLDAWYTTILNTHRKAQQIEALPIRAQRHAARRHHLHSSDSCDSERSKSCDVCNFFDFFDFPTFLPTMDLTLPFYHLILTGHRSSLAMPHPIHRSHCSQVFYVVAIAYIAVARS